MGPSTRVGVQSCADRPAVVRGGDVLPERGQRDDRMAGAVQGGPDELGHARVDDDLAPAPVADVQDARNEPAGAGDERPAGFDGEAGRPPVLRERAEELGQLAREPFRARGRLVGREDREAATDVERVERLEVPAQQRDDGEPAAHGVTPRIDRPELRPDVEMDPARPDRARRRRSRASRRRRSPPSRSCRTWLHRRRPRGRRSSRA